MAVPRHCVVLRSFFTPSTTEEVIMSFLGQQRQHYGDNTPTKPGTEAAKAAAGTNETRPDAAKEPESEKSILGES